jgi:NADPH:quinone reductase-like Zn-dependent oxidoreductase/acyl carrier protein
LSLVQALASIDTTPGFRLALVTRAARNVRESLVAAPHQATLWGLGKAVALEHPELGSVVIDLDPSGEPERSAKLLAQEVSFGAPETEVAIRGETRLGARLVHVSTRRERSSANDTSQALGPSRWTKPTTGLLADLRLEPFELEGPGAEQVEIEVLASALNFRDVLVALDIHHDFDSIGSECAGRVTRLGEDVTELKVGDEVVAIAPRSLATHAITDRHLVARKPEGIDFGAAAGLPIAFLTADYALSGVGGMQTGDLVLIHAAAGGVGLAALQLAQQAGAEVFATAGSPEKRKFLQSLGVRHVMDSRSLDFADEVMRTTEGRGVDIVLNAMAGDYVPKGLSILAPGGRFLELGKSDVWTPERAHEVNPEAQYHAVDLTGDIQDRPKTVAPMLQALVGRVEAGAVEPLPCAVFAFAEAPNAFRFMEEARHIGKVVLSRDSTEGGRNAASVRNDGTYLVTGGLGGLGLVTAEWLVEQGARHLVLISRTEPSEDAAARIRKLEALGAQVVTARTDVSREDEVRDLFAHMDAELPPLRGVIHSAGVLDDGVLLQQTWERFVTVMAPKVTGSWLLHEMTRERDLDFFVLFSSVVSVLGGSASGNHAAANAFLDALAPFRRSLGLPAVSINWGAWAETGAAVRGGVRARIEQRGLGFISPYEGLTALERILQGSDPQIAMMRVDWASFLREHDDHRRQPFFDRLDERPLGDRAPGSATALERVDELPSPLLDELHAAYPSERRSLVASHVETCVAKVLGLSRTAVIDHHQPLSEMGLDSLMAVELRNTLRSSMGQPLPATLLFDYPTVQSLSDHLAEDILKLDEELAANGGNVKKVEEPDDLLGMIEGMSDDEIDRLLGGGSDEGTR